MFFEFGGDFFEQVGVHVNRHEVKRDVILFDLHRAEEEFFFPFFAVGTVERVRGGGVHFDG